MPQTRQDEDREENALAQFFISLSELDFPLCRSMLGMKPKTRVNQGHRNEHSQQRQQNILTDHLISTINSATVGIQNIYNDPMRNQQWARDLVEQIRDFFEKFVDYE